eukprot:gene15416-18622_t
MTSVNGKYSLAVPSQGQALEFSYLGYLSQTVQIGTQTTINVKLLSDSKSLSEVVVTALGIKRETKALGYAAQSVKGDDLTKADQGDVLKSLSGKIAGVQVTSSSGTPGAASYIQLRGSNSLTGNNQPLFVIDGSPVDNSQNYSGDPSDAKNNLIQGATNSNRGADIDPNDIESITVLKGPAAAAIYGIDAANGAVVITTKRGKAGKMQVDFNTGVSFDKVNRLPKLQNQWVKGQGGAIAPFSSTNRYSWGAKVDTLFWNGIPNEYDQHGDIVGRSNPSAKIPFVPYDNINSFFRTGSTFNNSVAVSGGNEVATYRASVSNSYSNSIVPLQNFQRTSVSFSGDLKISEKLKISTNMNYITSNGNMPQQGSNLSGLMLGLTRTPISFDNSNGATKADDPKAFLFSDGLQRSYRNGIYDNPYWTINKNPYKTLLSRLLGNLQLDYTFGNGFSATYRAGLDTYNDNRHQYYEIQSGAYSGGRVFDDRYTYRSINSDLILSYTKIINDKWRFDGKLGGNLYNRKLDELYVQGDGLISPGFDNIYNASTLKSANFITPYRKAGIYYDLNLSYNNMLFLETTGRNDWTSTLPKNKNSFFYPSANLSFVFSELDGIKDGVLSLGKIRASIAQVGKDPAAFQLTSYYVPTTFPDGYTSGISFPANGFGSFGLNNVLGNPNLKPEKTTAYELGTQLQFFNNRLGLDLTFYYSKGNDLIVQSPVPGSSGYQYLTLNTGSIRNRGLELQVTGTPVKTVDFEWNSFLNFSMNRSKVLALAPGVNQITLNGFTGTVIAQLPGAQAGAIYGYGYTRDNNGNIIIDDRDNLGYPIVNTNVQKQIGNPNPKFLMGFGNTFTYKGLSLYTLLDWKFKGDIWNGTRGSLAAIGTSDLTNNRNTNTVFPGVSGHLNANGDLVHFDGSGNEVAGPGAVNSKSVPLNEAWYLGDGGGFGNLNEAFIEDGSYIKLREVSLSYNFSKLLNKGKNPFIKGLTAGLFARNILIWTPYHGVDPETSLTGATSAQGLDYFNNPGTSSYGLNLKVVAISLIGTMGLISSCKKGYFYDGINDDPSQLKDPVPSSLLPGILQSTGYVWGGDASRFVSLFMQQTTGAANQSVSASRYAVSSDDVDNMWTGGLYGGGIMNNTYAMLNKANSLKQGHYAAIAKILMANNIGLTTDLWGDVPYTEAFQGLGNLQPKYDPQQQIYAAIDQMLSDAITSLAASDGSQFQPGKEDLLYKGDLQKWGRFAHSLRAKFYLHLAKRDKSYYDKALLEIPQGFQAGESASIAFAGTSLPTQNPWFQFNNQRGDIGFTGFIYDLMGAASDPRLNVYSDGQEGLGTLYGGESSSVVLMSYDELKFIEAECQFQKTAQDKNAASVAYNAAVTANLQRTINNTSYAATVQKDATTIALSDIMTQKYIALFLSPEVWADWRRTGLPALTAPNGSALGGQLPRSLPYPSGEQRNNSNSPRNTSLTKRVWWDVQ